MEVRDAAIEVVQRAGLRSHDFVAQLAALFRFVRDRITFVRDIYDVETLQGPLKTLTVGAGDCDDRATLLVALARSIGIPAELRFRVAASDPSRPREFSHVYVVARFGARVFALDPTYPDNPPGYQYPLSTRLADAIV